jgi:hypothetical protein
VVVGTITIDASVPSISTVGTGSLNAPYEVHIAAETIAVGQTIFGQTFARSVTFPADFAGSVGTVGVNPTLTAVFTINQNGTPIGTMSISTAGAFTFSTSGIDVVFAAHDRMTVVGPTPVDATLADLTATLTGTG